VTPAPKRNWSRFLHRLWLVATVLWVAAGFAELVAVPQRILDRHGGLAWTFVPPLALLAVGHAIAWALRGLRPSNG